MLQRLLKFSILLSKMQYNFIIINFKKLICWTHFRLQKLDAYDIPRFKRMFI